MFRESDTQIGTLRVRTNEDNTNRPTLCRRLSYLLNTVDFSVPGISPSGILVVRHLADPLPGKLTPQKHAVRVNREWEQAARSALKEKYCKASRAVRGYIPPDAEAVFFEDEGQMLAALALDISRGQAWNQWWWKVILRDPEISPTPDLKTFLCKKITVLPAVLYHLAEWRTASEVVNKLSPDQAITVLGSLNRGYSLDQILVPLFRPKPKKIPVDAGFTFQVEKIKKREKGHEQVVDAADTSQTEAKAPWQQWFPSHWLPVHMTGERAALLGIGLSLFHKPAQVRTTAFAQEFHDWWNQQQIPDFPASAGHSISSGSLPQTLGKSELKEKEKLQFINRMPEASSSPVSSLTSPTQEPVDLYQDKRKRSRETESPLRKKKNTDAFTYIRFEEETETQPSPISKQDWAEEGIETQLGGVFYLVNLITRLDLLASFQEECQNESQMGSWGVLELLAKALLADQYQDLETDPLWPVLAQLDGRETGIAPGDVNSRITRWLEEALSEVRSLLKKALGPPTEDNPEPERTMLRCQARVYVTSTHVDIVMGLENISLPVRMAGLDRDPGWVADFARVILFHFE
jgi:hypothetical protein